MRNTSSCSSSLIKIELHVSGLYNCFSFNCLSMLTFFEYIQYLLFVICYFHFPTVLCSDTAPDKNTNWREIFNTEKDPCDHCFCSMDESYFTLFVPHFSWYAIPGNCQTKMFSVIAYHSRFLKPLEHFKIRMYCIPDFEKSRKVLFRI